MSTQAYDQIPELSTESKAIARRRKIAETMMAQSQTPLETNQMAGGYVVPVSWTQGLAKLAQAYLGNKTDEEADKSERGLADKRQKMVTDALTQFKNTTQGTAGVEGIQAQPERTIQAPAPMQQGQVAPNYGTVPETVPAVAGREAVPAVAGNSRKAIMDAMVNIKFPEIQAMIAAQTGFDTQDATKEAEKLKRKENAENALELAKQKMLDTRATALEKQQAQQDFMMMMQKNNFSQQESMARLGAALRPAPAEKAPLQITDEAGNVKLVDYQGNLVKDLGKIGKPTGAYAKDANKLQQASEQDKASALKALKAAGYDPNTGEDAISDLIKKSTSGFFQKQGANILAAGDVTTSGREALNTLESASSNIVMQMMGGKLGSGISNADRDFVMAQLGDVSNPDKTSGERLAAWKYAKARMIGVGMLPEESKAKPSGAKEKVKINPVKTKAQADADAILGIP